LDTDVEGLASRGGLDLGRVIGQFPTLQDPQCKVCHDVLDPVAGLFKNWNITGRFLGNNKNWLHTRTPQEMLSPGYNDLPSDVLPESESGTALHWLATKISTDGRFVDSTIKTIYNGFSGMDITDDPVFYQSLRTLFTTQNFNLKKLIKAIVVGTNFLADNSAQLSVVDQFNGAGTAHLLTPEQLDRKIKAIFNNKQWISPSKRHLLSEDSYLLLYGGIDSKEITERTTQATSIIAGIQKRIANQLACEMVPLDLNTDLDQRKLFPFVTANHVPDNSDNTRLIKQNIQYLFSHILGRDLSIADIEINHVYALFVSVIGAINTVGIENKCQGDLLATNPIVVDGTHTVRAWMAVVNFMLRDYYFLYE